MNVTGTERATDSHASRSRGVTASCWSLGAVIPLALATPVAAQLDPPAWTRPTAPFHIVGNIWYVGTEGLAAYAIKTPKGAISSMKNITRQERVWIPGGSWWKHQPIQVGKGWVW